MPPKEKQRKYITESENTKNLEQFYAELNDDYDFTDVSHANFEDSDDDDFDDDPDSDDNDIEMNILPETNNGLSNDDVGSEFEEEPEIIVDIVPRKQIFSTLAEVCDLDNFDAVQPQVSEVF